MSARPAAPDKYPDLEIVIVTNSKLLESLKSLEPENAAVRLVPYDKRFNFSDKCNVGAEAATGERLIFFNDDVEPARPRLDPEPDRAAGEPGGGRGRAKTTV